MCSRTVRILTMSAMASASLLAVFLFGHDEALATREATAVAMIALIASLPLIDSVMFGSSVRPETAGVVAGLAVGFFVRQSTLSELLARGAERVLATAFAVSLVLFAVRKVRAKRQSE